MSNGEMYDGEPTLSDGQLAMVALAAGLGCPEPLGAAKEAFSMAGLNGQPPTEGDLNLIIDTLRRIASREAGRITDGTGTPDYGSPE